MIRIEALQLESETNAAPYFTIVVGPSVESKQLGDEKKEYAERHMLRKEFWIRLLEKAKERTNIHSNISPCVYHWIGAGGGKSGISYNYVITQKYGSSEIYFDKGKEFVDPNVNKQRFDKLLENRKKIEQVFGEKLLWERLDNRRASRISYRIEGIGLKDKERWNELQDKMIDAMIRLEKAFKPYIRKLD